MIQNLINVRPENTQSDDLLGVESLHDHVTRNGFVSFDERTAAHRHQTDHEDHVSQDSDADPAGFTHRLRVGVLRQGHPGFIVTMLRVWDYDAPTGG